MLSASQIVKLIPEGGSITLSFTVTKDGNLSVLFKPQYPSNKSFSHDVNEAVEKVTAPRLITGTPEELDGTFMELIEKVAGSVKNLSTIVDDVDKDVKEAAEKIKAEGIKKVEASIKEAKKKEKIDKEKEKTAKPAETSPDATEKEEENVDEVNNPNPTEGGDTVATTSSPAEQISLY
jgi:PRTRC genetic system protein E